MASRPKSKTNTKKQIEDVYDDEVEQEDDVEDEENELEDEIENMLQQRLQKPGLKRSQKDQITQDLIRNFGSLVSYNIREGALPDHAGKYHEDDKEYIKLPSASVCVVKAQQLIKDNDDRDTKDITIFVAQKKWVNTRLRPLLELCKNDDNITAMRCCKLAITLMKGIEDSAIDLLTKNKKKSKSSNNEEENNNSDEEKEDDKKTDKEKEAANLQRIQNVKRQVAALLSFKEALCTPKCNEAISNLFRISWGKENITQNSDAKRDVAACLFYLRRVFAIETIADCSTSHEIIESHKVHNRYIVQLRPILRVVPAICAGIADRYHDEWLRDIILILFHTLKNFSSRDMYQVWKDGMLLSTTEHEADTTSSMEVVEKSELPPVVIPESLRRQNLTSVTTKGKLSSMLSQERAGRAAVVQSRHSRFGGTFSLVPAGLSNTASSLTGSSEAGNDTSKMIISNPFSAKQQLPEARSKRNKKNLTFAKETLCDPMQSNSLMNSDDGQRACVVMASVLDMMTSLSEDLSTFPGIRQLVFRVNEDRRRDEMMISNDLELNFFHILFKALMYNRLKLAEEKRRFDAASEYSGDGEKAQWKPDMKNVINSLDKMSLTRVSTTLERLYKQDKKYKDVVYAMELYKEQICYFRVLLESSDETHNFVALFGLYRIFYSSTSRLDQLPKLLLAWRPGLYDKHHLEVLVELLHETMKTLDVAKAKYRDRDALESSRKRSTDKDMDLYISACLSFDVNEYFKRLISNQSVRMYTRLLKEYNKLEPNTIHYIYCFFHRMYGYKLEDKESRAPDTQASEQDGATLGHMLFNINTLVVFSEVLNDTTLRTNKLFEPMLRMIRSIVRKFVTLSAKNHLLFVEVLFQHAHAHDVCESWESVYDAKSYFAQPKGRDLDSESDRDDNDDYNYNTSSNKKDDYEGEAHFDSEEERRRPREFVQPVKEKKRKSSSKKKKSWTQKEDDILREQFPLYAGTASVFDVLSQNTDLIEIGNGRTPQAVEKRVRELKLFMNLSDSESDDDKSAGNKAADNDMVDDSSERDTSRQESSQATAAQGLTQEDDEEPDTAAQESAATIPWDMIESVENRLDAAIHEVEGSQATKTALGESQAKKKRKVVKKNATQSNADSDDDIEW